MLFCILVMQSLPDFISTGWWECTQIGERLNKKVIESCRGRVNFGGYIFANFRKMYISYFTMVLIIKVSIVGFCTYFAFLLL